MMLSKIIGAPITLISVSNEMSDMELQDLMFALLSFCFALVLFISFLFLSFEMVVLILCYFILKACNLFL